MKLKARLKEYEETIERYRGVIRILERDIRSARREGAEDLARSLLIAYSAYEPEHPVKACDVIEDIKFFVRKFTEG